MYTTLMSFDYFYKDYFPDMIRIKFIITLFTLLSNYAVDAQLVIDLGNPDKSKDNILHFGHITLEKPYEKPINYTIRLNTLEKPKISNSNQHWVQFLSMGNTKDSGPNSPYANLIYALKTDDSLTNSCLEITVQFPAIHYSTHEQHYQLKYFNTTSNNLTIIAVVDITIRYEQPEILSLTNWLQGSVPDLKISSVVNQEDYILVRANRSSANTTEVYKIRLLADERFVYRIPNRALVPSFGLLNLPMKIRFGKDDYFNKHSVQWNNFAAHFGLSQIETHTHFSNGHYINKTFGIGLFIHPSRQEIRHIRDSSSPSGLIEIENPIQASFLGAGFSLYYSYNGFSFHFIPIAMDLQLNKRSLTHSAQDRTLYLSIGMGYTPKKWL